MSSEFNQVKLGKICDIKGRIGWRGYTKDDLKDEGPIVIGAGDITTDFKLDISDPKHLSEEKYQESPEIMTELYDILIVKVGNSIGKVAILLDDIGDATINPNTVLLKRASCNPLYLYYYLISHEAQHYLISNSSASAQPAINQSTLKKMPVTLPPKDIQDKIAEQLGILDQKIHLNQQANMTLEAMAQAIFKSWFVDFDPVRAKIEAKSAGRAPNRASMAAIAGISLEQDWDEVESALDQKLARMSEAQQEQLFRTAQLFPDELEESGIEEVPKGWEISEIGKEVNSVGGTTPRTKNPEYWDGGKIAWTTPKDLSNANSKILLETNRKITDEGLDQISSGLLPIDTVLMSSRAPVGYLALSKIPVAINQGYIAMICDQVLTAEYVLHWTESNMDMIKQHAGGSTFSEISKRNFRPLPVLVPSESVLKAYSEKSGALYDLITANMKEIKTLENLRDTLLPKLISGEIKVN